MSTSSSAGQEHPSTYFVQNRSSQEELNRLHIQDHLLTKGMGGVLPEQPDPTSIRRLLDIGCGTGGWLIEVAKTYPSIPHLIGVDISGTMLGFARAQAEASGVGERVEFLLMDALRMLEFPDSFFDLANLRLSSSFLRTWDWPKLLTEMERVTRSPGIMRVTDLEIGAHSTSPALTQLYEQFRCALYRAGHLFEEAPAGLTAHLERLLAQYGCQQAQTKHYALEYRAQTPEGEACYEDAKHIFQTLRPFIQKWGCASSTYDLLYQQMLHEMQEPDFCGTWDLHTVWGNVPPKTEK